MQSGQSPGDSRVSVRVAPVEFVAVVHRDRERERLFRRFRPFEELLDPVHPEPPVHLAPLGHLPLRRVPERIVGFRGLERFLRIDVFAMVSRMAFERLSSPVRPRVRRVVRRRVQAEVVREFPADDEFFEKRPGARRHGSRRFEGDALRGDLAEMKVRREPREGVPARVVPVFRVAIELLF